MTMDDIKPGMTISLHDGTVVVVESVPDVGQDSIHTRHPTDDELLSAKLTGVDLHEDPGFPLDCTCGLVEFGRPDCIDIIYPSKQC